MERHVNQVLAVVADDLGVPVEAVMVEDGAVFYDTGKGLRCARQAETAALMARLRGTFSR